MRDYAANFSNPHKYNKYDTYDFSRGSSKGATYGRSASCWRL